MRLKITILFLFVIKQIVFAQSIPMGSWQVHLAYNKGSDVAVAGTKVYCVANGNLFSYNASDNALKRISKIDGLSDIEISSIAFDNNSKTLIVGYNNANVDFIVNDKVVNLPDIKRKQLFGDKKIYSIYVNNNYAYLAMGFGIVKLDIAKQEIKETYYLVSDVNGIKVNAICSDSEKLYAATTNGIYYASLNSVAISNPTGWKKFYSLPVANYNTITLFNNKILANKEGDFSKHAMYAMPVGDTLWSPILEQFTENCFALNANKTQTKLAVSYYGFTRLFDANLNLENTIFNNTLRNLKESKPLQCDFDSLDNVWIADGNNGLIKNSALYTNEKFQPLGPATNTTFKVSINNQNLWVTPGGFESALVNLYNKEGISNFNNKEWKTTEYNYITADSSLSDVVYVLAHPSKSEKAYAACWGNGLLEIESNIVTKRYDNRNSILKSRPEYEWTGIGGLAFDASENLWLTNSYTSNFIAVLANDGKLYSYDASAVMSSQTAASQIIVSSTGQKWCRLAGSNGVLVFDEAGTLEDVSDDKIARIPISSFVGSSVFSLAEDKDGVIWTGTDKGINVIYNTGSVFDDGASAQQIKVELDGYVQYLLETETVTAIAVDGGNRKWVGTINSGVYLLSSDGTEQILHFTKENSALLSNEINSIVINDVTGEVFFGTSAGVISYRSDASESSDKMNNVYAFPNPVKPNFTGVVSIVGLAQETDVKITDAAGNIVAAIVSQGGTATWDLNNFQKQRVKSGVYMALCSNPDGSLKATTKIVVLN